MTTPKPDKGLTENRMKKSIQKIAREDGRFSYEAIEFIYEGLGHTVKHVTAQPKHISGDQLCLGLRDLAKDKFGRMAKVVLNKWGIETTRDFGEIVYLMIKNNWMSAQPGDEIEDFNNVFDFKTDFEDSFEF